MTARGERAGSERVQKPARTTEGRPRRPQEDGPGRTVLPSQAEGLLRMQRTAGNRAMVSVVERRATPADVPSPSMPVPPAVVVQRCAPRNPGCDCPADEKGQAGTLTTAADADEVDVQRQPLGATAPGAQAVVQRAPSAPPTGVPFRGRFFPNDPAALRTLLETLVVEKGAEGAESAAFAFLRMENEDKVRLQLRGVDPALLEQVQKAFEPVVQTFQKERAAYVTRFRDEAAAGARLVLQKSREALVKEWDKYSEDGAGTTPDLEGLRKAAKALAAKRRDADAAARRAQEAFTAMRTQNQAPAHPGVFAPPPVAPVFLNPALREAAGRTNEEWFQQEQEYGRLRATHEAAFPALALYAENEDGKAAGRLEDLPTWGFFKDSRMKKRITEELEKRIKNNDSAFGDLDDKDRAWELPRIIDLTLKGIGAKPHEEKWVKHAAAQKREEKADRQRLLAAITVGFAVAAGVLSLGAAAAPAAAAGTAVLAGLAATAQLGTTALTIATAYQELMDYRFKKATSDTSLDRANSLADEDPSFLWLAVTLVGAITETAALKSAFVSLKGAVQAAKAARNTVALAEEVGKIRELSGAAAESITNRVKAEIDELAPQVVDPNLLQQTGKLSSSELAGRPDLLRREFELAQSSPARRVIKNETYAEEVILENGHVWRKQRDNGRWCRFSGDPLCFIFGEGGGGHIDSVSVPRKARQGIWSGEPGKSDFTPNDPVALVRARYRPIPYRNGYPDFNQFAEGRVLLTRTQFARGGRDYHFRLADEGLARQRGWLLPNGEPDVARALAFRENPADPMTWHHVEGDTLLLLVPRPIHRAAQHAGGIAVPVVP